MTDFEREDRELAEMMGEHFIDATKGEGNATMPEYKPEHKKPHAMDIPVEEQWQPAKPAKTAMDRVKAFTKDCMLFGTASMFLFWCQQTGRMDYTTSWYALLVCVGMVFVSIDRHWGRRNEHS